MINYPPFEFHISRKTRDKYNFDRMFFSSDGKMILADYSNVRKFVEIVAQVDGIILPASEVYALGLIDESLHLMIRKYAEKNPDVINRTLARLEVNNVTTLENVLSSFLWEFPPLVVYERSLTEHEYIQAKTAGLSNKEILFEEMLVLRITNLNPAIKPYREFFDETGLKQTGYPQLMEQAFTLLNQSEGWGSIGEKGISLISLLRSPALASPNSLSGQLDYILENWGVILGLDFTQSLLRGMDHLKENQIRMNSDGGFSGSAPVIQFTASNEEEDERFSQDKDWMPNLILLAKNSYVWLDQLSRLYERDIRTLDAIPEEELQHLAEAGITGLWLIGLWERSSASQKIKQMMGNPEAVASAYSLKDYQIAEDLGGWQALENLRTRAWQKGIRLSADMVPNHMGIDSDWVINNPEWFISIPNPPYPNYSYQGADLSSDPRIGIFLEDHYYDRSDAAVVFKRHDRWTGDSKYIYHGNDGTSMPWNDTAQLDFLKAEVREQVIQTILHVARNFPIIRFDAAMTLAKRHIQRLWFPEPGSGGAIASRSEFGLTREQFERAIPVEFWREVVDRVAREAPDTLLLAEAFWMMEGYFVRTLGMHRVYNSAFMHMMRDEDNTKYRAVIKNTIEFDPEILKRYVNFMNNPDEKTAREQFGNGDKYFGVATLMATLPGLPMIGHGQIEGFLEKYGMEYRRAYWDEVPDSGFIEHHQRVIFPLFKKRYLFAGADEFELFDFFTDEGVNENVFTYANGKGTEKGLVVYHNKYAHTSGWIKISAAKLDKADNTLKQKSLSDVLNLKWNPEEFLIFRDVNSGLEFIRPVNEIIEKGLYFKLHAYQTHVFLDFRVVIDLDGKWKRVADSLAGSGYWSLQARFDEMFSETNQENISSTTGKTSESDDDPESNPSLPNDLIAPPDTNANQAGIGQNAEND